MSVVSQAVKDQLRERLARTLSGPVELRLRVRPSLGGLVVPGAGACETCDPAREIAAALAEASDRVTLVVTEDRSLAAPVLEIARPGEPSRISFEGLPSGYEFSTLLDAVERVSSAADDLAPETRAALGALTSDVELMVFVTPTCPYCPGAASLANRMALASPRVRARTVEANEFPELSDRFGVRGVPQTVVNGSGVFVGALPEPAFLERVLAFASPPAATGDLPR